MVGVGGNAISSEKQSWDRIGGWGEGGGTREFRSGCQQNRPYNASGGFGGEL